MRKFRECVASHRKCGHSVEAIDWLPWFGLEACDLEFQGKPLPSWRDAGGDVRVNSRGERSENLPCVRRITFIFSVHIAAITEQASADVARQSSGTEDLGQP